MRGMKNMKTWLKAGRCRRRRRAEDARVRSRGGPGLRAAGLVQAPPTLIVRYLVRPTLIRLKFDRQIVHINKASQRPTCRQPASINRRRIAACSEPRKAEVVAAVAFHSLRIIDRPNCVQLK